MCVMFVSGFMCKSDMFLQRIINNIERILERLHSFCIVGERHPIGMVVIRGNSIVLMEAQERIGIAAPS
jgi:hypothetical protein